MHTKNSLFDNGTNRHVVETRTKLSPEVGRVPPLALIIETVSTVYSLTLMVSSQKIEGLWIFDF